jgi:hypothetical protein
MRAAEEGYPSERRSLFNKGALIKNRSPWSGFILCRCSAKGESHTSTDPNFAVLKRLGNVANRRSSQGFGKE